MPYISSITNERPVLEILAHPDHVDTRDSRLFDSSYVDADAYSNKYVYAGLVVAIDTATTYYVPWDARASYGTGSDTAEGVLRGLHDFTFGPHIIEPVNHGELYEDHCYVWGAGVLGAIPAAVKTSLSHIRWV